MIYNSQNSLCKTPFGAVTQNTEITFRIFLPNKFYNISPRFIINKDGCESVEYIMDKCDIINDTVCYSFSYLTTEVGLYFYYFDLYTDYQKIYKGNSNEGYITHNSGDKYQLTVYDKNFETPQSFYGGVMYQIFPDRFYESKRKDTLYFEDRIYRENKKGEPYFWANEIGGHLNFDYFGGDLQGINEKLPYLKELGINIIYLNPIFEAHSNHRYNTADYLTIDPVLGTQQDFINLCEKAKENDIKIILDGVFSHTGADSIYFNKNNRYDVVGAYNSPESIYRSWYDFSSNYKCGYRSWWGFESLPEVDETSSDFIDFICGDNGVINKWLSLGASGFRLDVADELPDDFIEKIRQAVKKCGDDKLLLGEVWEDATNKFSYGNRREYLLGKSLDSIMNYPFKDAIIDFMSTGNSNRALSKILSICENYPSPALNTAMNFLSTHDTVRIITQLAGYPISQNDRYWQSNRKLNEQQLVYGKKIVALSYAMLFFLPGIPSVYYGDEIAMQGYRDPFNRAYFDWDEKDTQIKDVIKYMGKIRLDNNVFKKGKLVILKTDESIICLRRIDNTGVADICINRSEYATQEVLLGNLITVAPLSFKIRLKKYN